MRADLPAGTVTFLFTDIEGSTRLLDELGVDSYAEALAHHRSALRSAFTGHGGVEVDTQGDALFFVFESATEAVGAAVDGRDALTGGPIRVRMGLHTGTPLLTDEGYVGTDVHRAARITAVAHGGQVVVSSSAADPVDHAGLVDLGMHRLKDLSAAEHIYQVGPGTFPPLRSLYRSNLPVPATPLIGRQRESSEVVDLLSGPDGRLVTVTGPGGSGKTRLALQAAALASDDFPDGVFWVPLASVAEPDLVATATAASIGAPGSPVGWLADRRALLVLDNFEHLLEAAPWVAELIAAAPHVRVLITSREPLRVAAEQQYGVSSLDESEAVELFAARARAIDPAFRPDEVVPEICRRLDCLPLAIELAAARVKSLSPTALLSRLDERLQLLTTGPRDAPSRQRNLRATIAWSHDLLAGNEQRLFRRLGVFSGCTLDAAEQVADGDLETLESLTDKSLLRRTGDRFWLLETIREYALERLAADDDPGELRRRHVAYYAALAESAHLSAEGLDKGQRHQVVIPEIANIRAAIDEADAAGDRTLALSIAVSLEQYWVVSSPDEGRQRLTALLQDQPAGVPPVLRARALRALGGVTYIGGGFEAGYAYMCQALDLFRDLDDEAAVGHLLMRQAAEAMRVGDPDEALRLTQESARLSTTRSDEAARLSLRAEIAWRQERPEEALELLRCSADLAGQVGFVWWQGHTLISLAEYALAVGKPDVVIDALADTLGLALAIDDWLSMAYGLSLLARFSAEAGDDVAAGTWWGAVEAGSMRVPIAQWDAERADLAVNVVRPTDGFVAGEAIGQSLTLTEAARRAVGSMRAKVGPAR
jgi:predicted ATPase